MPWFRTHKKQLPGQTIEAQTLRAMAQTCDWMSQVQAQPPLSIMGTQSGPLMRLAGMIFSVYIFESGATGITARSGSTPGSGSVTIQTWNGTALASLGITKQVYNWNSTPGGIGANKYGVMLRICGSYWVLVAEC